MGVLRTLKLKGNSHVYSGTPRYEAGVCCMCL